MSRFYRFARVVVRRIMNVLYRIDYQGSEHIPQTGGFIICANHTSNLDPVLLGLAMNHHQVEYMAKEELFHIPVLGFIIRKLGAFPVRRGKGDTGAIKYAEEVVKRGGVLGIFPEGGRSKDGKPMRPKSGAALIASQTGADVLPVGISFEPKRRFRRGIVVRIGKLIPNEEIAVASLTPSELKRASTIIMSRIVEEMEEYAR